MTAGSESKRRRSGKRRNGCAKRKSASGRKRRTASRLGPTPPCPTGAMYGWEPSPGPRRGGQKRELEKRLKQEALLRKKKEEERRQREEEERRRREEQRHPGAL